MLIEKQGEEMLAKVMRHMPPNFFDRLPKYVESLSDVNKKYLLTMLDITRENTAFYSN